MNNFPGRFGYLITAAFTVIMAILMLAGLGLEVGLPILITNGIAFFLIAAFSNLLHEAEAARQEAEKAREESQRQQLELQAAHRQLKAYTAQAEELAVLQERNRMARNLHDSVTQTIFSMRLTAEAANMLFDREPARAREELIKLQTLAKSALTEMRSLIFELRPTAVTKLGLVPALRHHIMTLERQTGLTIDLQIIGEPHLSELEAQRLFRISQEALNNVVKHAQTDKAFLTLRFDGDRILLQVADKGIGFDLEAAQVTEGHIGLSSMQERVDTMGGQLTIDSHPGQGTRVVVEVISPYEEENNGKD
jgi:signal transduction histidine kinase